MPAWFINFAIGLVFSYISFLLRPTPEPPKAATLDDVDIPVAKQGQEIAKIYGTVWMRSPNVHWYGDFKTVPIKATSGKKG